MRKIFVTFGDYAHLDFRSFNQMTEYSLNIEQLVRKAQLGDKGCLEQLASQAQQRLRADIYRLTLEDDLTAEIVQETIVEMFKILGQLKDPQRFWSWLYKIAINKYRFHLRTQSIHKTIPISVVNPTAGGKDALTTLIGKELNQSIYNAMRRLKPEHRAILTMRCYREMDYSLIADSLGCSRFAAKMLFYRAKKALAKQLACLGIGRGSLFIALVLFGKMTAESEAAAMGISVSAPAMKVGVTVSVVGALSSTTGIVTLATIGVIGTGTVVTTYKPEQQFSVPQQQLTQVQPFQEKDNRQNASQQCWYYYPQGPAGPVMMRLMKKDDRGRDYCYVLRQNEEGNYYFDEDSGTIYVRNCRWWNPDFTIRRLPTDQPSLRRLLSSIDGAEYQTQYVPYTKNDLLIIATEGDDASGKTATISYQQHLLDEEYFHYNLPASAQIVDQRDEMHKRGWTYFTITGDIKGQKVSGRGRIPFVYATSRTYYPWLNLSIGADLEAIETGKIAGLCNQRDGKTQIFPSGSLLKGLCRPWIGLHTIDIVRRDAAEKGLSFDTKPLTEAARAEVTVVSGSFRLVYTIDMQTDVIETIDLFAGDTRLGQLVFSYMQYIDSAGDFTEPSLPAGLVRRTAEEPGILWLFQLLQTAAREQMQ